MLSRILILIFYSGLVYTAEPVRVGILDTTINPDHPSLSRYFERNTDEISGNARDDDGNGFIDDFIGYSPGIDCHQEIPLIRDPDIDEREDFQDFVTAVNAYQDLRGISKWRAKKEFKKFYRQIPEEDRELFNEYITQSHGSHVANIALRGTNAKLFPISFNEHATDLDPDDYEQEIISPPGMILTKADKEILREALVSERDYLKKLSTYIKAKNLDVVNMSIGSDFAGAKIAMYISILYKRAEKRQLIPPNPLLLMARARRLARALIVNKTKLWEEMTKENPDTLFVAAASNDGKNLRYYPSSVAKIDSPNTLIVGALNSEGKIASFSNRSRKHVDVYTRGTAVESTSYQGGELLMSGTSQATPAITNLSVRIKEKFPDLTPSQIKQKIIDCEGVPERCGV